MALEHITVLDLTHMLPGPCGTMMLADLGARTNKVEAPGCGEGMRRLLVQDPDFSRQGMGACFPTLKRNKQSMSITSTPQTGPIPSSIPELRRLPVRFAAKARHALRPPQLGEHTQEVLGGLIGYSAEQVAALRASGAIA